MPKNEARFGIERDGRYSQYWKLIVQRGTDDLILVAERTGDSLHVTLHNPWPDKPKAEWHVRINVRGKWTKNAWDRPTPIRPGITRVIGLALTPASARYPLPKKKSVTWLPAPTGNEWMQFTVWLEEGTEWEWRGFTTIARLPRSDGGHYRVTAAYRPSASDRWSGSADAAEVEEVRRALAEGTAWGLMFFSEDSDGSPVVADMTGAATLPQDKRVASPDDARPETADDR